MLRYTVEMPSSPPPSHRPRTPRRFALGGVLLCSAALSACLDFGPTPLIGSTALAGFPVLLETVPPDGTQDVELQPELKLVFSQAMQKGSTSLELTPNAALTVLGWDADARELTVVPTEPLATDTTYSLSVQAASAEGVHMERRALLSFRTIAAPVLTPPRLVVSQPSNAASDVATDVSILLQFSTAMNRSDLVVVLSPGAELADPLWNEDSTEVRYPAQALSADTPYTLAVSGSSTAGLRLPEGTIIEFRTRAEIVVDTQRPSVVLTAPVGAGHAINTTTVSVSFDEDMDFGYLPAQALTVTRMEPSATIPCVTQWMSPTLLQCTMSGNLTLGATYVVTLDPSLRDAAGNTLTANSGFSFTTDVDVDMTRPTLQLWELTNFAANVTGQQPTSNPPAAWPRGVSHVSWIKLTFSEAVTNVSVEVNAQAEGQAVRSLGVNLVYEADPRVVVVRPRSLSWTKVGDTVEFIVSAATTDTAGNAIQQAPPLVGRYRVIQRKQDVVLNGEGSRDGYISSNVLGTTAAYPDQGANNLPDDDVRLRLGWLKSGSFWAVSLRAFYSFACAGAFAEATEINAATLSLYQSGQEGTPYAGGQTARVYGVDYGTSLTSGDFGTALDNYCGSGDCSVTLASAQQTGRSSVSTTSLVEYQRSQGRARCQFRVSMSGNSQPSSGTQNFARFYGADTPINQATYMPRLTLDYYWLGAPL